MFRPLKKLSSVETNKTKTNDTKKEPKKESQQQRVVSELYKFPKYKQNVLPRQKKRNVCLSMASGSTLSGDSYAESSSASLKLHLGKKHFMGKEKRQMLELRRAKWHSYPTHSSDSSLEDVRVDRTKKRCLKRKSKMEKQQFWLKYNEFLNRSLNDVESSRSSSSSDSNILS